MTRSNPPEPNASALAGGTAPHAETLLREVNHRVGGSLQLMASLAHQAEAEIAEGADAEASVEVLRRIRGHITTIALIQRLLYGDASARGGLTSFLGTLTRHLKTIHERPDIDLHVDEEVLVETEHIQSLGLILCELIANALRHGYEAEARGTISVRADHNPHNTLRLRVQDDGRGFKNGFPPSPLYGLNLVQDFVDQFNGHLHWEPCEKGTSLLITLPMKRPHLASV